MPVDSGLRVQRRAEGAHVVVLLSGRITIESSPELRTELLQVLDSDICRILSVDFSQVSYLDTSGVAILMEVLRSARAASKAFQLKNLDQRPRYLLQAIGLLHFFDQAYPDGDVPIHPLGPNSP